MAVVHAGDKDFDKEVLHAKGVVVVDFFAEWCGPCKIMAPRFEEAANELKGVKFVKVNVEEAQAKAQEYGVMSIPTLLIFKDGKVVDQSVGAVPKDTVKKMAERHV
ncbi:MAG: thioredoxin [Candidatus Micrarchaeota archaeon]